MGRYGYWSWRYEILKRIVGISFRLYFKELCVTGRENIPGTGRIIFTANHQNALLDALAIIFTNKYQTVYLARADLFRNPLIARIMRFLKIMPVYRLRDGKETMGENEDTFDIAASLLASGGCIGIMPEGNHHGYKRLRTLKKGFGRIALRAEELNITDEKIKIVPVGLNFSNISGFRGELVVNYGKPIEVARYLELYRQSPQKGINALKEDLAVSLGSLILNVKDEENYHQDKLIVDMGLLEFTSRLEGSFPRASDLTAAEREICTALYEYYEAVPRKAGYLRKRSAQVLDLLDSSGISREVLPGPGRVNILPARIAIIAMYPVILTGLILHLFPVTVIHFALKKVREPEFIGSFKFLLGTLLVPVNYLLISVVALFYFPVIYSIILPGIMMLAGMSAAICHRYSAILRKRINFSQKIRNDKEAGNRIAVLKNQIILELEPVLQISVERLGIKGWSIMQIARHDTKCPAGTII
jgi:1-acyl-sn-glycerol-3-phosphate acyltransferase